METDQHQHWADDIEKENVTDEFVSKLDNIKESKEPKRNHNFAAKNLSEEPKQSSQINSQKSIEVTSSLSLITDSIDAKSESSKKRVHHNVKHSSPQNTGKSTDITMVPIQENIPTRNSTTSRLFSNFPVRDPKLYIYISVYSMLGTTVRILLARIFGQDCDGERVGDFLSNIALCVTSTGTTIQRGGAIFIDLPANILGSYVMGVMTGLSSEWPAIPWLKADHPLQSHTRLHTGIRVGFCGCLTTFASWVTQMITMMDGYGTVLGSQICAALFGFLLGLHCSTMSFVTGRHTAFWINSRVNPHLISNVDHVSSLESTLPINNTNNETRTRNTRFHSQSFVFKLIKDSLKMQNLPFIVMGVLFTLYVVADKVFDISFYRSMWISSLLSPPGVILRYKLSTLNGTLFQNSTRYKWIPWGTLAANIIGCIISSTCTGILSGFYYGREWDSAYYFLSGMKSGFAGSLSTVSTYVKEIVQISEKTPGKADAYFYAIGSIMVCWALSLCIYSPLVRID